MVQDDESRKYERKIKQYIGVEDGEVSEGTWIYYSDEIKDYAPYLLSYKNEGNFKIVYEWLLKQCEYDGNDALVLLGDIALVMRRAIKIHPWDIIDADSKNKKIEKIVKAIGVLEKLLQDEDLPTLPEAVWFLGTSRGMWEDRKVLSATHKWCSDNKVICPQYMELSDFFDSLKSHVQGTLNLKKAAERPNPDKDKTLSRTAVARIFTQRVGKWIRRRFKATHRRTVMMAALVEMAFPDVGGIDAAKIQEWLRKKE